MRQSYQQFIIYPFSTYEPNPTPNHFNQSILSKQININHKIITELMNKENNSIFTNTIISSSIQSQCPTHQKPMGLNFCVDCLTYRVCPSCITSEHSGHQVLVFQDPEQTRYETRQTLLQTLEETLKGLKRKENEIKNRTNEVQLVKDNLKKILSAIMGEISEIFKYLEEKLSQSITQEQRKLESYVHKFYQQYNQVNDQLREHLIGIMNCQINIFKFDKQMIVQEPPPVPDFDQTKDSFQKYRTVLKNVSLGLKSIKQILMSSKDQNAKYKGTQIGQKIDRYLQNSRGNEKVNESFMRTLSLIGKENAPVLNLKRLNRKI